mgnify:CR=1 FL=1
MKRAVLGELCDFFNGGAWSDKEYVNAGIPVLKVTNCKSTGFQLDSLNYLSEKSREKYKKNELVIGDVIIATVGSHPNLIESAAGRSCIVNSQVEGFYLNQNAVCVRTKDKKVLSQKYLGYLCKCADFQHYIQSRGRGAANQMRIAISSIREYSFTLPDIENQQYIADTLSAYDDLIENNQKQIKLLEEAAQRLYKEWFVDLRFPGHENTKIVDGVPEGWNECTVESFGTVITGKTPSTSNKEYYTNGKVPFVTIPDMHNVVYPLKTEKRLTIEGAQTQKNKYIPPNSVMISCIGTVGLVSIATEVCQTNQQINSIILYNEDDLYFFYESMLKMKDLLDGLGSNGATMINVNKSKLEKLIIISPSKDIVKQYNDVCKPLFESALNLSRKNVYLQNMREALLPKLMSGEVEI